MTQPKPSHLSRIALARLANQGIATASFAQPGDVVTWLGAMQAQDYGGALWSIGLRMAGVTEREIEQAIAERAIVRTWPMRGTLHFVAAKDVRWMLALLTPRVIAGSAGRYRQLELDETIVARSKEVFAQALQGGKQLTRDEMLHFLEQANIATAGQRGHHLLARSAQDGLICFGSRRGKQQTFALLDEWVPRTSPLACDEALAELTRRYFISHGPATMQDLMRWAGLTTAEAKIGLEAAGKELVQETIADRVYWMSSDIPDLSSGMEAILSATWLRRILARLQRSQRRARSSRRPTHLPRRQRHVQPNYGDRWPRHGHLEADRQERHGGHRIGAIPSLDPRGESLR